MANRLQEMTRFNYERQFTASTSGSAGGGGGFLYAGEISFVAEERPFGMQKKENFDKSPVIY